MPTDERHSCRRRSAADDRLGFRLAGSVALHDLPDEPLGEQLPEGDEQRRDREPGATSDESDRRDVAKSGIDGVGTKIQTNSGGTINQRGTYIYRSIDYTVAAGGFAFLLGDAGLVSGPIGTITDWVHFRNLLRWQSTRKLRNTILTGDEVRLAWREIRECRHPRFFFPRTA